MSDSLASSEDDSLHFSDETPSTASEEEYEPVIDFGGRKKNRSRTSKKSRGSRSRGSRSAKSGGSEDEVAGEGLPPLPQIGGRIPHPPAGAKPQGQVIPPGGGLGAGVSLPSITKGLDESMARKPTGMHAMIAAGKSGFGGSFMGGQNSMMGAQTARANRSFPGPNGDYQGDPAASFRGPKSLRSRGSNGDMREGSASGYGGQQHQQPYSPMSARRPPHHLSGGESNHNLRAGFVDEGDMLLETVNGDQMAGTLTRKQTLGGTLSGTRRGSAVGTGRGSLFGGMGKNGMGQSVMMDQATQNIRGVNGTFKIRKIIQEVHQLRSQVKVNCEDIGDSHFHLIQASKEKLRLGKERAAQQILAIGERIAVEANEVRRPCIQLVEDLFKETDQRAGNAALMGAMSKIYTLDLPGMVNSQSWCIQAALDGSANYLATFLSQQAVVEQLLSAEEVLAELLEVSLKNVKHRASLFLSILKSLVGAHRPWFVRAKDSPLLGKCWQEAFELIANKPAESGPGSEAVGDKGGEGLDVRQQCLEAFFSFISGLKTKPIICINFMRESSQDKQNIFSRAARQGDAWLVQNILKVSDVTVPPHMKKVEKKKSSHEVIADVMAQSKLGGGGRNMFKKSSLLNQSISDDEDEDGAGYDKQDIPKLDINRRQSDNTTALMQAVAANHLHCVVMLCKHPYIDVLIEHPKLGHALGIAQSRNCDAEVVKVLRQKFQDIGALSGDDLLTEDQLKEKKKKEAARKAVMDGTTALRPMLIGAKPQFELIAKLVQEGAEPRTLREQSENLERTKTNLAQKIVSLSEKVTLKTECFEMLVDCVDNTIKATDRRNGSLEFLQVVFQYIYGIEWAKIVIEKRWVVQVCTDASWQFLGFLLRVPYMKELLSSEQLMESLEICFSNRTLRIPLVGEFLENEGVLKAVDNQSLLIPFFNRFYTEIASHRRHYAREDKTARFKILRSLINNTVILIDAEVEDPKDKQTIFSRAAFEGDIALVQLLLETPKVIRNVDRVQGDGTTALQVAVKQGHFAVVEYLLSKRASPQLKSQGGLSALEIAQKNPKLEPRTRALILGENRDGTGIVDRRLSHDGTEDAGQPTVTTRTSHSVGPDASAAGSQQLSEDDDAIGQPTKPAVGGPSSPRARGMVEPVDEVI